MDLKYVIDNINNPKDFVIEVISSSNNSFDLRKHKNFEVDNHDINDVTKRPKKTINLPYPDGRLGEDGKVQTYQTQEEVNRISLAYQKLITTTATSFAAGGKCELVAKIKDFEEPMFDKVEQVLKDNRFVFKNYDIIESLYSETEVAEIWYTRKKEIAGKKVVELKANIYKPSEGYKLYPLFDGNRDLIGFGVGYTVVDNDKKEVEKLDFYTEGYLVKYTKNDKDWVIEGEILKLPYPKIPVIYYKEKQVVWHDVQSIINRLETLMSNFGDTNDYNGSPILVVDGSIEGFSSRGETGKVIETDGDATVKYVSWDSAPESIKLEIITLLDFLHTLTQTPDMSFKTMMNLGNVSGDAMVRILTPAHLKAIKMHNGSYGEGVQRRLNFLVSAIANVYDEYKDGENLKITPEFGLFIIADESEKIRRLQLAGGNKPMLDHLSLIKKGGMSQDPKETLRLIREDAKYELTNSGNNANNTPAEGTVK